jgi:hypothetical protein
MQELTCCIKVIYEVSMISALGPESVEDPRNVERTFKALRSVHKACYPSNLIFPLLPTPSRVRSIMAGMHFYWLVRLVTNKRESEGSVGSDVLQTLINEKTPIDKMLKVRQLDGFSIAFSTAKRLILLTQTMIASLVTTTTISSAMIWLHGMSTALLPC